MGEGDQKVEVNTTLWTPPYMSLWAAYFVSQSLIPKLHFFPPTLLSSFPYHINS